MAHAYGRSKIARRCGTSAMLRLVMNPKMKNRIATVMNGPTKLGAVAGAGGVDRVAMRDSSLDSSKLDCRPHHFVVVGGGLCRAASLLLRQFAPHNTICNTPAVGRRDARR